ncbi:acetolactate synthase AlsS [Exiguobacterium antarcticum]|uniref:Acetolactate synthase AlsS n=1 Tax=Exiguobacterium antarcticum TaxID=132920 RepID=A0ABT6QXK1_9BACL|nr:acetolactate synthase AlsS [Exiguobacterium antarcticum]AFS71210.1 Acetolactate synthase, catabolic [Exiguobacterium antarcticum B7]MDI3233422.1 acetolactate synthase AlsS [Exiguobacterium antarcticum]
MDKKQNREIDILVQKKTGADLVVDTLIEQGVDYIFGIPGAKIDSVFNVLQDRGPELIVARHEQNAAFMAQAIGRLTDKPGVVLVTSGPGASNLATGLVTANSEGDPVVAIAGAVTRADRLKRTHQSMDNQALFTPITNFSAEVQDADNIPEVLSNAFRTAETTSGAAFVSIPQDVGLSESNVTSFKAVPTPKLGIAPEEWVNETATLIEQAKLPVLLLGMRSSQPRVVQAIRGLLQRVSIPVVQTFQAAGTLSRELESNFYGRVGLFRNQPGDALLAEADLVLAIGYDPIGYDPKFWNQPSHDRTLIHLDQMRAEIDHFYRPDRELVGDVAATINALSDRLNPLTLPTSSTEFLRGLQQRLEERDIPPIVKDSPLTHPLYFMKTLREQIADDVTVTVDVGSHYIWMARHFRSYEPRHLLFSNGMQTLGVALPWAIAATLVRPGKKAVSISGDGGFLFSAMELETAVRLNAPLVHFVWRDSGFDMVAFQQEMKYNRKSGTSFGEVDLVKYAESFGAKGLRVNHPSELVSVMEEAWKTEGPVIVDVPIDYSDNITLGKEVHLDQLN